MTVQFPPPDNTRLTPKAAAKQLGMELLEQKTSGCAQKALVGSPAFARMAKQVERSDKEVAEYTKSMMQLFSRGEIDLKAPLPTDFKKKIDVMGVQPHIMNRVLRQFTDEVMKSLKKQKISAKREELQERAANIIDLIDSVHQLPDAAARAINRIYS